MASIVYEGLEAPGPGTLFQGKKLFIHRRCPMHQSLVAKVGANGGQIVPLEKNADICIHDHARKGCPPGSVSWKFIDDCIKYGRLLDPEDPAYLIRPTDDHRPVGSALPIKTTRAPYTAHEDADLKKRMLDYLMRGNSSGGNAVYQEYARYNPRHTWQSWKDRWRNHLEPRLTQAEKELIESGSNASSPYHIPNGNAPPRHSAPPILSGRDALMADTPGPSRGTRLAFTKEDDQLILDYVRDRKYHPEGLQGSKIWREFALLHPHHSDQSWRSRYVKTLRPRLGQAEVESNQALEEARKNRRAALMEQETDEPRPDLTIADVAAMEVVIKQEPDASDSGHDAPTGDHSPSERQQSPGQSSVSSDIVDPEIFRELFQTYRARKGLPRTFSAVVCGTILDSWYLFQAVNPKDADPESRDWVKIAMTLGFDCNRNEDAPTELERFYERHFGEFESQVREFVEHDETYLDETDDETEKFEAEELSAEEEEEEEAAEPERDRTRPLELEDQDGDIGNFTSDMEPEDRPNVEQDNDLDLSLEVLPQRLAGGNEPASDYPSSPPILPGKRKASVALVDPDLTYPSSRKRKAYGRERIIPSTPSHRLGLTQSADESSSKESSIQRAPVTAISCEPETQDFRFETQAKEPLAEVEKSEAWLGREATNLSRNTPPQQIRSELAQWPSSLERAVRPPEQHERTPTLLRSKNAVEPTRRALPASFSRPQQPPPRASPLSLRQGPSASSLTSSRMPALRPDPHESSPLRQLKESNVTKPAKRSPAPRARRISSSRQPSEPGSRGSNNSGFNKPAPPAPQQAERPRSDTLQASVTEDSLAVEGDKDPDATVQHLVSLGYRESVVRRAMKAASYDASVAKLALEPLMKKEPLPDDVKGLWTRQDDEDLKRAYTVDTEKWVDDEEERKAQHEARITRKALRKKHGKEAVKVRRKLWFEMWGIK